MVETIYYKVNVISKAGHLFDEEEGLIEKVAKISKECGLMKTYRNW